MKNPKRMRELTDNFCVLDAALAGLSYTQIAKYYQISPARIPQLVWYCIRKMTKGITSPFGIGKIHIYKKSDVILYRKEILQMLYFYNNGLSGTAIPVVHVKKIRDYALNISKKRRFIYV